MKVEGRKVIESRRNNYNKEKRDRIMATGSHSFFKCVNAFLEEGQPSPWNISSMMEGKMDEQIVEEAASYFNRILEEYAPLDLERRPVTFDIDLPELDGKRILALLKLSKKPKTIVPGDMYPESVPRNYTNMVTPIKSIFYAINPTKEWPMPWKIEYQSCIPKTSNPENLGQCRNISCIAYLSKVYELYVLQEARKYVKLSSNQYGGEKGVSATHFLTDVWQRITADLEDNRARVVMTAIDYSKAFNRLEHQSCLEALADLGLPNQLLAIIGSFLSERSMTVRLREASSAPKRVNAGAPQGSVLGSFLFNVGVNDLDQGFTDQKRETEPTETRPTPARTARNSFLHCTDSPVQIEDSNSFLQWSTFLQASASCRGGGKRI